tara:strand:+ start:1044 stop:4151 length:3108 start_codon:yes stop_codon:yes gene_type:complete
MNEITAPYKNNSALVNLMVTFSRTAAEDFYDGLKNGELRTHIPDIFELTPNNSLLRFEAKIGAYSDSVQSGFHYDLVLGNLPSSEGGDSFESRIFTHQLVTRKMNLNNDAGRDVVGMPTLYMCWGYGKTAETWSSVHQAFITDVEYDFTPKGDKVLKLHLKDSLTFELDALALRKSTSQVGVEVDFTKSIHWNLSNLISKFLSNSFSKSFVVVDLGQEMDTYLNKWEEGLKEQSFTALLDESDLDNNKYLSSSELDAAREKLADKNNELSEKIAAAETEINRLQKIKEGSTDDALINKSQVEIEKQERIINQARQQIAENEKTRGKLNQEQHAGTHLNSSIQSGGVGIEGYPSPGIELEKKEHSSGEEPINLINLSHEEKIERWQRIARNMLPNSNLMLERKMEPGDAIKEGANTPPAFIYENDGKPVLNPEYSQSAAETQTPEVEETLTAANFAEEPWTVYHDGSNSPINWYWFIAGIGTIIGDPDYTTNEPINFKSKHAAYILAKASDTEIAKGFSDGPASNEYFRFLIARDKLKDQGNTDRQKARDEYKQEYNRQLAQQQVRERAAKRDAVVADKATYYLKLLKPQGTSLREYIFGKKGATGSKGYKGLLGDLQTMFTVSKGSPDKGPQGNLFDFIVTEINKESILDKEIIESGLDVLCYFGHVKGYGEIVQAKSEDEKKMDYYHEGTSFRKVYSLACTSSKIVTEEEGEVALEPESKDLVFTFGRKGVDIEFATGALTTIIQDPVIIDLKYNLYNEYYLSLMSTPLVGGSTAINQEKKVLSPYALLAKLGAHFGGDKGEIIEFILKWTNQTDDPEVKKLYEIFLAEVINSDGEVLLTEANSVQIAQLNKDVDTLHVTISRADPSSPNAMAAREALALIYGLGRQSNDLKNKRWFGSSDNNHEFSTSDAEDELVFIPTYDEELYIDNDPEGEDAENALLRLHASQYAFVSTKSHSVIITVPGIPELSTITELFGPDGRKILLQIFNHRIGTHHWLSGKYNLWGMEHHISATKGYTTKLRLQNGFENLVGGQI